MYKYALFDLDGTLTDPELGITNCVAYALRHFGIEVEDLHSLRPFIGPPLVDSFMRFYSFSKEDALEATNKYRERFETVGLYENEAYGAIYGVLDELRRAGVTLAVASSKPEIFTKKIIEHFDMSKYFAAVCGSELDGRRVNKAEVIAYALDKLGSPPSSDVIMIGDREYDIIGAHKNGVAATGVLYGFGSKEELTSAGADKIAATPEEIPGIILK